MPPDTPAPARKPGRVFVPDFVREDRRWMILVAGTLATSMGFIDGTIVSIAAPAIRADLDATLGQTIWINLAYMVTLSALILVGGAFADRFGLARVFRLGIALFMAMSITCAVAPSPEILILARLAEGAGAAMMVPGSLAIISRAYPRESRTRAISLWAGASSLATAAGTILGVTILTLGGDAAWRWIFAISLPLGMVALWLLHRGINTDASRPGEHVDLLGGVLATLGLGFLAWGLASGEDGSGFTRGLPLLMVLAGGGLIVAFILHQRVSRAPMMPLNLFRSRAFSAANLAAFALYFGLSSLMFYLPMLTIKGWGVPEIITMIAFAPMTLCMVLFSTRFGRLADSIGPGPVIAGGSFVVAAAQIWMSQNLWSMAFWSDVMPPMLMMGFGMSMVVAPLSTAVMGAVGDGQSGVASGVNNAVSRTAGLIAVAIMGTVVAATYVTAGGTVSYGVSSNMPGHSEAMTAAFARIALICGVLSALAGVTSLIGIPRNSVQTSS